MLSGRSSISSIEEDPMTATVVAWWFLLWAPGASSHPTIVGPFDSVSGCEAVRTWSIQATHVTSQPVAISPCWSGPVRAASDFRPDLK